VTVVALASAKGSPGVTTTALALALVWPRPVIVAECDPAGGEVTAGFLAGTHAPEGGLLGLALELRRGAITAGQVPRWCARLDTTGSRLLLAAPSDVAARTPIGEVAARLVEVFAALGVADAPWDVLVDCGRLDGAAGSVVFAGADRSLLLVRPTLRATHVAQTRLAGASAAGGLGVLVVGDAPYGRRDVEVALGVPVVGVIGHDPVSAAVLGGERPAGRGFTRGLLLRSARTLADTLIGPGDVGAGWAREPAGDSSADVPVASERSA